MAVLYPVEGSKILVCMCGLPARGKTYIAQKGYPKLILPNLQQFTATSLGLVFPRELST